MQFLRQRIGDQIHAVTGLDSSPVDFTVPPGDPGLFGPDSAVWIVHSDFTSMLIGGVAALYLQMLDPRVLAGVWDHSNFRQDLHGRLARTAQFISAVSYGGREQAEQFIARVRRLHERVRGHLPDGTPYDANDPELLAWVHHSQAYSFLRAHLRYRRPDLAGELQDRYIREYRVVAQALGADAGLAWDRETLQQCMDRHRALVVVDERTREVARILRQSADQFKGPKALAGRIFMASALDLLPPWAQACFGHEPSGLEQRWRLAAVSTMAQGLRWATRNGSMHRARRRMGLS